MSLPKKTRIPKKVGQALMRRYGKRRGRRVPMPKQITGNVASRMEQFSLAVTAGIVYDFTFNILDLLACQQMAKLYQYYRITSVELRFKPYFDTYIANSSTGNLPYLNFQYDKSGALQGTMDANNFEQIGTKAIRMDDKTLVRRWKPSVLTNVAVPAGTTSQFKVSPWLPTHVGANAINDQDHYGAVWYISKTGPSDATVYDVDVVVNVQFRKPYIVPTNTVTGGNPPRVTQTNETAVKIPEV